MLAVVTNDTYEPALLLRSYILHVQYNMYDRKAVFMMEFWLTLHYSISKVSKSGVDKMNGIVNRMGLHHDMASQKAALKLMNLLDSFVYLVVLPFQCKKDVILNSLSCLC